MSVKIRLTRHGSKKQPYYRIVVAASDSPRDGRFIEIVGHYNPNTDPASIDFKADRLRHWLDHGATPTTTVKQLIKKAGALKEAAA
jgi:small subunit ribosomal protein S16